MALTAAASSVIAASIPLMVEPDLPRFRKTPSGVKIQEVVEGSGLEANNGDLVEFNYVCRRSNGYFVYSTVDQFGGESQPVVLPLGEGKIISGLEEVIVGMKPGGKRRALVPPAVGYVDLSLGPQPQEFGPRRSLISHANEPLVFEVQLLKIKSCSAGDSSKQLC
jgi:FKBP-type peptidyl-prolyl cis-trans isomerase